MWTTDLVALCKRDFDEGTANVAGAAGDEEGLGAHGFLMLMLMVAFGLGELGE